MAIVVHINNIYSLQERALRKTALTSKTTHAASIIPIAETKTSFIDDIKNAALVAQNHMGFIYEPSSGLYYDSQTGYYYNAVRFPTII